MRGGTLISTLQFPDPYTVEEVAELIGYKFRAYVISYKIEPHPFRASSSQMVLGSKPLHCALKRAVTE